MSAQLPGPVRIKVDTYPEDNMGIPIQAVEHRF
jgi:hypothetical protein